MVAVSVAGLVLLGSGVLAGHFAANASGYDTPQLAAPATHAPSTCSVVPCLAAGIRAMSPSAAPSESSALPSPAASPSPSVSPSPKVKKVQAPQGQALPPNDSTAPIITVGSWNPATFSRCAGFTTIKVTASDNVAVTSVTGASTWPSPAVSSSFLQSGDVYTFLVDLGRAKALLKTHLAPLPSGGIVTTTFTATDAAGNTSQATASYTVLDQNDCFTP